MVLPVSEAGCCASLVPLPERNCPGRMGSHLCVLTGACPAGYCLGLGSKLKDGQRAAAARVNTSLHSCDPRSTCNSLKLLATRKDTGAWDGKAKKEMQAIWENGLQVEYVKFENYLSYMLYCAEASVARS